MRNMGKYYLMPDNFLSGVREMRMRHITLVVLCLWSCVLTVTARLNEEQVGRATNYIGRRFTKDFNYQYAYFVKFTADECNRGLTNQVLQEALKGEDAEVMYEKVNDYEIYEGSRMVASSYLRHQGYDEHAEHRLLTPDNNSPISRLLSKTPVAGCAIFYSRNSPCISKCIAPDGTYNIISKLKMLTGLPQDRVFAFGQVYWRDASRPEETWASWKTFNDDMMPLYRCTGNNCVHCFRNGVRQNTCMNTALF